MLFKLKRHANAARTWASANRPEVLSTVGALAITVGAAHLATFAAWVVGGAFAILGGWIDSSDRANREGGS